MITCLYLNQSLSKNSGSHKLEVLEKKIGKASNAKLSEAKHARVKIDEIFTRLFDWAALPSEEDLITESRVGMKRVVA